MHSIQDAKLSPRSILLRHPLCHHPVSGTSCNAYIILIMLLCSKCSRYDDFKQYRLRRLLFIIKCHINSVSQCYSLSPVTYMCW